MHFMGRRRYEDLPGWCKGFDIGLIPFKINPLTEAVNPIKLREYLSAGLPVVSTPMPEVLTYNKWIRTANSADELIDAVEQILTEPRELSLQRSSAMADEVWPAKLDQIIQALYRSGA